MEQLILFSYYRESFTVKVYKFYAPVHNINWDKKNYNLWLFIKTLIFLYKYDEIRLYHPLDGVTNPTYKL